MSVIDAVSDFADEMIAWRRDIHAHPELAFQEHRTSALAAQLLESFGLEVFHGLACTGVVGTLKRGDGPAIGLRADMDALPIEEKTGLAHASQSAGVMHACGHDGHTAMLLGAARFLSRSEDFQGTVHFIFQPAEELRGGAQAMIKDGLFERFPMQSIFGLHNWPDLPAGQFGIKEGPVKASCDIFEITVTGKGGHGGMPHLSRNPITAAAGMITALQTVSSRSANPLDTAVLTVTGIKGGNSFNVIPDQVTLRGTARAFQPEVRGAIEASLRRIAGEVAKTCGVKVEIDYQRSYPPTVNHGAETELAVAAALKVAKEEDVIRSLPPSTTAEDFACMLERTPGCYAFLGNGTGEGTPPPLHSSRYDFNDAILPIGVAYWVELVREIL